ncbi:MAG: lysylphosphatidylglycerol synthase transmembrane domain-containing protein [Candidatus Methylomirabilia bacterium]
MTPRGRLVQIVLGVGISLGLLAYLLVSVDLKQVGQHLARTHWGYLGLTVVITIVAVWLRARRWHYLFPPGAAPSRLFGAVMIGYMANNILPLRAGELVRGYVAGRRGGQGFWTAIATLVVERVLDALAVVVILAGLVLAIPVPAQLRWGAAVFLIFDIAAIFVLGLLAFAPERCVAMATRLLGRWPRLEGRTRQILKRFMLGLQGARTLTHLLPILMWSVAIWLAYGIGAWTALAAGHLRPSMTMAWAVIAFVGLGISVPSAPGFIGVFQAAVVVALALFDIPRAEALSFSFLLHATQFFPVTLLGWIFLMVEQMSMAQITRLTVSEVNREGA